MTAATGPQRVPAIVTTGAWDPRPEPDEPSEPDEWDDALRRGGTSALIDRFKVEWGEAFAREFPPWAQAGHPPSRSRGAPRRARARAVERGDP